MIMARRKSVGGGGPGLFADFRKHMRDLLYKDFQASSNFNLAGAINYPGTRTGDSCFLAGVNTQLKNGALTTDVKMDTNQQIYATISIDEPVCGLKTILSFVGPGQNTSKVTLQYRDDYVGISTSIGLIAHPIVSFSGVIGLERRLSLGTDVSFDIANRYFTKFNVGLIVSHENFLSSGTLSNNGRTFSYSAHYIARPQTCTAVGYEVSANFSTKTGSIAFGAQHALDPLTIVKSRINIYGNRNASMSVSIQRELWPESLLIVSGEVDTKAVTKGVKLGLALSLN